MTWLFTLGVRLKGWAMLAGAVLVAVGAAYLSGRRSERADARAREARDRLKAIKARKEIDDEVDAMGAGDLDAEYRRWMRRDDR